MKLLKKGRLLLMLPPVLLLLIFASFTDVISCPIGYCFDGVVCVECSSATKGKAIGSLVNPPNSSTVLRFSGNQAIDVKLTNNNFFLTPITVNCNYQNPPNASWSALLGPFGNESKAYSILGHVPIGWKIDASTISDAAAVSILATWDKW